MWQDRTRQVVCLLSETVASLHKNRTLGDKKMVSWFLLQNAVADISIETSVLVSLCCWPAAVSSWQHISHLPMVRSSHTSRLKSSHTRSPNIKMILQLGKNPKGCGRFILDVKWLCLTTYYEVMWIWTRPVNASSSLTGTLNKQNILMSLLRVQYIVPCWVQFSSLHSLFFLTYISVTHLWRHAVNLNTLLWHKCCLGKR